MENLSRIILVDPTSDNIFEQLPHFVTSDPRSTRLRQNATSISGAIDIQEPGRLSYVRYNINKEFLKKRYDSFFHEYDLQDKRVLDLGCCVGAVGAYVLSKGAKYYVGVEYSKGLSNIATINLSDSFDTERWRIENDSNENFAKNLSEKFDIVVASGILYSMFDPIPLLLSLHDKTDAFIIESMQPKMLDTFTYLVREKIEPSEFWKKIIEEVSFIQYHETSDYVTKTKINGSYPSIGFCRHYMDLLGFKDTKKVHERLKTVLPNTYCSVGRYGERFERYKDTKEALGYVEI